MSRELSKKQEKIISWALVILGAVIYISLVFNENVWLDEAFTASLVRTDMAGVLERSMADTLPPLYNIILKISTDIFGYKVPVMKLTSVMPMIITMILSATVVRRRHGFKVSTLFTIALFTMPNLLFFGVEIRMYSLGFLFATASGIYAYEFLADYSRKNLIIFTVVSVLAGYSHHFAFVSVGFVYLYMLLYYFFMERQNIRRWFICLLLTILLYFPCLIVTLKQFKSVSGYFTMPDVTLSVFLKYVRYPYTVGNVVSSITLLVSVAALVIFTIFKILNAVKNNRTADADLNIHINNGDFADMSSKYSFLDIKDIYALSMFLVYYGVLIFGTIVSKLMTANIFVDRYLFFAHGMLWLFFALEAGRFKKFYYAIAAVLVFAGICGYIREFKIEYDTNPDAVVNFLEENVESGDVLYTIEESEEMAFCLPFYDEELTNYENLSDAVAAADKSGADIWLTVMDYEEYDFNELSEYGLKAEYIDTFTFDRYTFDIYKVE